MKVTLLTPRSEAEQYLAHRDLLYSYVGNNLTEVLVDSGDVASFRTARSDSLVVTFAEELAAELDPSLSAESEIGPTGAAIHIEVLRKRGVTSLLAANLME